jgi:tetratricopeptide (TPR) repeat protein
VIDGDVDVDVTMLGRALLGLAGLTWSEGDFDAAHAAATRAEGLFDRLGDLSRQGRTWNTIGVIEHGRGDFVAAVAAFRRAIELYNAADDPPAARARRVAVATDNLGSALLESGDLDGAVRQYAEARSLHMTTGEGDEAAMYDLHLAAAALRQGRHEDAVAPLAAALEHYRSIGFVQYTTECLEHAAAVAGARSQHVIAASMLGAAATLRGRTHVPKWGHMQELIDGVADAARAALDETEFQTAWAAGGANPERAFDAAADLLAHRPAVQEPLPQS